MKIDIPIISGDDINEEVIKVAKKYKGGFYYTVFPDGKESEFYKKFEKDFRRKYDRQPNTYDAYAYEAAMILFRAVEEQNDKISVYDFLKTKNFDSLTGKIEFDDKNEIKGREYEIIEIKDGKEKKIPLQTKQ